MGDIKNYMSVGGVCLRLFLLILMLFMFVFCFLCSEKIAFNVWKNLGLDID